MLGLLTCDKPALHSRYVYRSGKYELRDIAIRRTITGAMGPEDRDYFILRARQERLAAAASNGAVRGRHEEFAALYEMRVHYIDRGLFKDDSAAKPAQAEIEHHIIIRAH